MDRYGHLFESVPITPVEWWDDLLGGADALLPVAKAIESPASASRD